jgi:hypothetical protein
VGYIPAGDPTEDVEFGSVTVTGERVDELLTTLTGPAMAENPTRYRREEFGVIAWDRWDSWRTNSDLMVAVVMDLRDDRTCEVTAMVGGGGTGAMGWDWSVESVVAERLLGTERGAEAAVFAETVEYLEDVSATLDLEVAVE